ncbi:amidohydrolase family protein [Paracoccus actinidiae]|uniref:amidohydrolase family protein n=1 Tax=Paracoccus actinidiae TaxID=3064531 RepID=UPI0027D291C4|nr:amidohydrolase [Paracoccus sp. M09]
MIFDTHLHLIDRKRLRYPWLGDVPALDCDWSLAEYQAIARRIGITDALHMEVDVAETDIAAETAWVAEMMTQPGSLIRGAISAARPEFPSFASWLESVDRTIVKGVRRVLHVMPDDLSQQPLFRDNIRRLGPAGLTFDLCVQARQLLLGIALADAAPDTIFILDHCGVPDIAGQQFASWAADIATLAKRPNVNVKLSGITAYTGGDWTIGTLHPWVQHIIDCFGPARVVWGSDSPVCNLQSSLEEWVATSHALLSAFSHGERAAMLEDNARRLWQIVP